MDDAIELHLAGNDASLKQVLYHLNRHSGKQGLRRVELRFSTQSLSPLAPQEAKLAIANQLREHGRAGCEVSVRPHQGPIEDGSGDHLLRMLPLQVKAINSGAGAGAGAYPQQPGSWWSRLLWRCLPARWRGQRGSLDVQSGQGGQGGRAAPVAPVVPVKPRISNAVVVQALRKAVTDAARYLETGTGTAIDGGHDKTTVVTEALVVVRLPELHEVLKGWIADDAEQASRSIAPMVRALGLRLAEDFKVSYAFQPRQPGIGTALAGESDLEVKLRCGTASHDAPVADKLAGRQGSGQSAGQSAGQGAGGSRREPSMDGDQGPLDAVGPAAAADPGPPGLDPTGTWMPRAGSLPASPQPAQPVLTLRVLGTLEGDFAQAFELQFHRLPARFDREALASAGFAAAHPELLSVASNSCPLQMDLDAQGQLSVMPHAGGRAMYFDPSSHRALAGPVALPAQGLRLIVNAPQGVQDPAGQRHLPALLIELLPGLRFINQARPMPVVTI